MSTTFDAIIIGTGQSGPSLAARLSSAGMKVAVVERKLFGGTCVNNGCVPTKALVASAYAAHLARHAADYGVVTGGSVSVDMKRVKARKDAISGRSNKAVENWMKGLANGRVFEGHARFESRNTVRVNGDLLTAEKIFINVGGRALVPPIPGLSDVPYFTNSSIMDVDYLPEHLIILGGSYIGLEFAQMYRRFGSEVTIVERAPRLIGREDEDVSQGVLDIVTGEGVRAELGAEVIGVEKRGDDVVVKIKRGGVPAEITGSHLLLAIGRVPNTDDLGLDKAGVIADARGYIQVDDQLRTTVPGIWAVGDCNGRGAFTHTSYNDYEIVADNFLNGDHRSVRDRISAYGLFIDPPLGRVGMTDDEIRKSGRQALSGKRAMTRVGRAVEKGESRGFMKITVDANTKEILGAAILGVGGDEAIHCIIDAMYAKAPYTVVQRAVHIHPTVCELLPTLLGELKPLAN
jgi:pyruvate/2-oxoglutarate dehydrogenase complex dihydrolipoamide dehydrogenase (E3) component